MPVLGFAWLLLKEMFSSRREVTGPFFTTKPLDVSMTCCLAIAAATMEQEKPASNSAGDSALNCHVCRQTYSQTVEAQVPRLLPECGHCYCTSCIDKMEPDDKKMIQCPMCKRQSPKFPGAQMTRNDDLLGAIESIKQMTEAPASPEKPPSCRNCPDSEQQPAVHW